MKPHTKHAPGFTGRTARLLARRPHFAVFQDADLVGCSCGKALAGDDAYRLHLKGRTA